MKDVYTKLESLNTLSLDESFKLAKIISSKLNNSDSGEVDFARLKLIHVLQNWNNMPLETQGIWTELLEVAGFYPYLEKEKNNIKMEYLDSIIRKEFHKSNNISNIYFHEEQNILLNMLNSNKNLIVSAPTSFGKSLLIEEIIASKKYSNIVVIQPTLALLDETRKKISKYKNVYKIIVQTTQDPSVDKGNIFLLTAERVMEYYERFPKIDFLCLDEFYKLSSKRDDERADVLNNAFYYLLKNHSPQFYLLGPNIDGISDGFAEKYNAVFYKTNYSLVATDSIDMHSAFKNQYGTQGSKKTFKENKLFELISTLTSEQTIVYCSSPERARKLAKQYYEYIKRNNIITHINKQVSIIEWIEKNISIDWILIDLLKHGIAFHDGALQKHISSSIIDYFNNKNIFVLFCTSTIIEGVNTSAKNVIFFDKDRGNSSIDFFDYNNIKGRAGRLMEHYVGKVYNFNEVPVKENITIDIQFFEQNPICDEVLIHLTEDELNDNAREQVKKFDEYEQDEKEIFKTNSINISGQKKLFDYLLNNIDSVYDKINWTYYPQYPQLDFVLNRCWDFIAKDSEKKGYSIKKLIYLTDQYAKNNNIMQLCEKNYNYNKENNTKNKTDQELKDDSILESFKMLKHWFQYKIPKWLMVFHNIQTLVCAKKNLSPGNYIIYANNLENDFIAQNLSILSEYGIPKTAIEKLAQNIPPDNYTEDVIFSTIKNIYLKPEVGLLEYEKEKIQKNII